MTDIRGETAVKRRRSQSSLGRGYPRGITLSRAIQLRQITLHTQPRTCNQSLLFRVGHTAESQPGVIRHVIAGKNTMVIERSLDESHEQEL